MVHRGRLWGLALVVAAGLTRNELRVGLPYGAATSSSTQDLVRAQRRYRTVGGRRGDRDPVLTLPRERGCCRGPE